MTQLRLAVLAENAADPPGALQALQEGGWVRNRMGEQPQFELPFLM